MLDRCSRKSSKKKKHEERIVVSLWTECKRVADARVKDKGGRFKILDSTRCLVMKMETEVGQIGQHSGLYKAIDVGCSTTLVVVRSKSTRQN